MAIFTEKYVSETKLREFERSTYCLPHFSILIYSRMLTYCSFISIGISGHVGKKVEAEIDWLPFIRSHGLKALGAQRVEKILRGLHTTQLNYLADM